MWESRTHRISLSAFRPVLAAHEMYIRACTTSRTAGISRHIHRIREIAVESMVASTAQERLKRAMRSNTRPAIESQKLQLGDAVDFHRPSETKDKSRGTAQQQYSRLWTGQPFWNGKEEPYVYGLRIYDELWHFMYLLRWDHRAGREYHLSRM